MFSIKLQLAEQFGTHIYAAPGHVIVKRKSEAGFDAALRNYPHPDAAKCVIIYAHPEEGPKTIVVKDGDRCFVMNENGSTVEVI